MGGRERMGREGRNEMERRREREKTRDGWMKWEWIGCDLGEKCN